VKRVAESIRDSFGIPDILVFSCASGRYLSLDETDDADLPEVMATTVFSSYWLTRRFVHAMLLRSTPSYVVIVGSPVRMLPLSAISYTVSRGALYSFFLSLQRDFTGTSIRAIWVEPSKVMDSSYFENNPGFEARMPQLIRDSRFRFMHQSSQEVGENVVAAIEKGSDWAAPLIMKFMAFCIRFLCLGWLFYLIEGIGRVPKEKGGPPTIEERRQAARAHELNRDQNKKKT